MSVVQSVGCRFAAGVLMVAGPLLSMAGPANGENSASMGRCEMRMHGPGRPPGPPGGPGFGDRGFGNQGEHLPPFLMHADLTEDQQDKVFAILHAAAPALRDKEKAAGKAREALRELVRSSAFSESSAATLAQAQGADEGQLALLRTRMEHELYAVLTPDQRAKFESRAKECDLHGQGGPLPDRAPPR